VKSGEIRFGGTDLLKLPVRELPPFAQRIAMVFQIRPHS